ncbi:Uncharacterised protein [Mycobacteroides abscessus subsp. abscessus]|nr:Uncharacterised protein [Mycobacteroides abscessus subsp. abscessus]
MQRHVLVGQQSAGFGKLDGQRIARRQWPHVQHAHQQVGD